MKQTRKPPLAVVQISRAVTVIRFHVCLLFVFFASTILATLPSNVLFTSTAGSAVRMPINIIVNQSFGYFTKPPQSDQIGLYVRDGDGRISDAMITPQSKYQNFLGVSRRQRTQGPEYAMIARLVGSWTDCNRGAESCVEDGFRLSAFEIKTPSPMPTICGDALITSETPTKWAYRDLVDYQYVVVAMAHVKVDCDSGVFAPDIQTRADGGE